MNQAYILSDRQTDINICREYLDRINEAIDALDGIEGCNTVRYALFAKLRKYNRILSTLTKE